jgi:hypothetical protein
LIEQSTVQSPKLRGGVTETRKVERKKRKTISVSISVSDLPLNKKGLNNEVKVFVFAPSFA